MTTKPRAPRACGWRRRNKSPCARASAWVQGEGFDGQPLTYWSRFCEYHELLAKQQGVPTDLIAEGDDGSAPTVYELVRPDPIACAHWVCERHEMWSEALEKWVVTATGFEARERPSIAAIHALAKRSAGWYTPLEHACTYVLPYAMSQPDYDDTIAHEVCHAYQRSLLPAASGHGEAWQTLMLHVVGNCGTAQCVTFHEYSVQAAIALGKSILPKVREAIASGRAPVELRDD